MNPVHLPASSIRELSAPSALGSVRALIGDWTLIALTFTAAILIANLGRDSHTENLMLYAVKVPLWILASVVMARNQLALAILMHDGAHRRLFKSARLNDFVCQFFCAAPLFFSMYSYQRLHLKHHRQPLATDDPDLSLIGGYPISRSSFIRKIARDAFGISYFKFIRYFIHMSRKQRKAGNATERVKDAGKSATGPSEPSSQAPAKALSPTSILLSILLMATAIWALLFFLGHGWIFLFFWVIPAVTSLQVLLRIRGIAEHAGYQPGPDQRFNARTVINPVQTFFFAPHNVNYHIEHHIYPAVPFHNLPKLHEMMAAAGLLPEDNVYDSYREVLADLLAKP